MGLRTWRVPSGVVPARMGGVERSLSRHRQKCLEGDERKAAEMASRLTGSADLFNKRGRKPWASVNFITAHDGFTLNDLVSYDNKHNEANGEENRDGHSDNLSHNYGVEGPTTDKHIREIRLRQMRNLI